MKRIATFLCLFGWVFASCGNAAPDAEVKPAGDESLEKGAETLEKEPAKKPESKGVSGEITSEGADGAPGANGTVHLDKEGDRITGKMEIGGDTFALEGRLEDKSLRLWVVKNTTDKESLTRGYLIGDVEGTGYTGTFSLSGNGGKPLQKGTFKTNSAF